jgi:hypothetical protein
LIVGAGRGAIMMIIVITFAAASCGYPVSTETRKSPYVNAMGTAAFDAFSVSVHCRRQWGIAVGNGGLPLMLKVDKTREEVAAD